MAATLGNIKGLGPVMTLKDTINSMGDTGKVISYLKVDIEGSGTNCTTPLKPNLKDTVSVSKLLDF